MTTPACVEPAPVDMGLIHTPPGPEKFFDRSPFLSKGLGLRDIHSLVFKDFERARGKFGRPSSIMYRPTVWASVQWLQIPGHDVVVQIQDTDFEHVAFWSNDACMPCWSIRIASDPNKRTRGLRNLLMRGPVYAIGQPGTTGPFVALTEYQHQTLMH